MDWASLIVAVGSFGFAWLSWRQAKKSAQAARESAADAARTAKATEETSVHAERQVALAVERNDVHWDVSWMRPGVANVKNEGMDDALDVRVVLTVDGEPCEHRAETVPAGSFFSVEHETAARLAIQDEIERAREAETHNQFSVFVSPLEGHSTYWRISWRTPLGRHHEVEGKHLFDSLLP